MQNTLKNESVYNYMGRNQIVNNEKFYSGSLAFFSMVPVINKILVIVFPSLSGEIMSTLYLLIGLVTICASIKVNGAISIPDNNFLVFLIVLVYFLISTIMKVSSISYLEIIVYTFLPLLFFCGEKFNASFYLETCLVIGTLGLPFLNRIFVLQYGAADMGVSYAFLLSALVPITYLFREKDKKAIFMLLSFLNLIYIFEILATGSRGCVLSIVAYLLSLFLIKPSKTRKGILRPKKRIFILVLIAVIILLFLNDFLDLFLYIFRKTNMNAEFFKKTERLLKDNDVLNGRKEIYGLAFQGFCNRFLLGNGLDSFEYYTGIVYPHNSILQLLFDFGIIGAVPIIFLFIKGITKILKKGTYDKIVLFCLFFFASVPGSLFSHDLWKDMLLWVTISMACFTASKNKHFFNVKIK